MSGSGLIWLTVAMVSFVGANAVLRSYAASSMAMTLVGALALFLFGNLFMVRAMREGGLALAVAISSVVQLVLLALIGVLWFGERLSPVQVVGVALGIVSVALIVWPQGARP